MWCELCARAHTHTHTHTHTDVEAISKFAKWEFTYGDRGRGGTMFESLITSYPRRTDLWSVYVDMLVKAGQLAQARCGHTAYSGWTVCTYLLSLLPCILCREVLERAIHLTLSAKKMKLMFKRYLEFERQHGSPAGMEAVKDKARTYVEAKMAQ